MGKVRVHLAHQGVVPLQRPPEAGDIRLPEPLLPLAVQHVDAIRMGHRQGVRHVTGSVR